MAMAVHQYGTKRIDRCVVLRALIEATEHHNRSSIHSVLPRRLPAYKLLIENKCISLAGNFDGHGNAPVRYQAHRHMRSAQRFNLSHWTPQLVEYLLRIAPATARVPYKLLIANKCISLAGNFDDHGDAPVQYPAH
jgi:hypothetical protein